MRTNKWTYELYSEEYWTSGEDFDTKEEAIEAGKEAMKEEDIGSNYFWIGQISEYNPSINASYIIDSLVEQAFDKCGEASDNFLSGISKEEEYKLETMLNDVLNKWLEETNNQPTFYSIENMETIVL